MLARGGMGAARPDRGKDATPSRSAHLTKLTHVSILSSTLTIGLALLGTVRGKSKEQTIPGVRPARYPEA
ncbi:hypothetical protein BgiBS90_024036, partial [Biomphalaria glabrata]